MSWFHRFRKTLAGFVLVLFLGSLTAPTADAFFKRFVRRASRSVTRRTRSFFSRRTVRRVFSTRRAFRTYRSFGSRVYRTAVRARAEAFRVFQRSATQLSRANRVVRRQASRGYRFVRQTASYLAGRRRSQSRSVAFSRRMMRTPPRSRRTRTRTGGSSRAPYARTYSRASYARRRATYRTYRRTGRVYQAVPSTRGIYQPPTRLTQTVTKLGGLSKDIARAQQQIAQRIASGATPPETRAKLVTMQAKLRSATRRVQGAASTLSQAVRQSYQQWGRTGRNMSETTQKRFQAYGESEAKLVQNILQEVVGSSELNEPASVQ